MAKLDYRTITDKLERKMKRIVNSTISSSQGPPGSPRVPEGPSAAHGFTSAYTCFRGRVANKKKRPKKTQRDPREKWSGRTNDVEY